ncbi:MAG: IS5 family transposase [Proteobacteria bacterium]|nr:IS5 family transposase [Pseudomonadota bacterium]
MPNKYPQKKGWKVPKQKHKVSNWSEYNDALRRRGDITFWLSEDAIAKWYENDRVYDGTGAPQLYTDYAITVCYEIKLVYKLPLRQLQGFLNSLFELHDLNITCPDYSCLSKRLKALNLKTPRYKKHERPDDMVHVIAVDSTGLKRFGRGEWHQEKYQLSNKASWRKLHIAVNESHYFEACVLSDRFGSDEAHVPELVDQIEDEIDHFSADGAYDKTSVYDAVTAHSSDALIVIPPREDAVMSDDKSASRNINLSEIKQHGRMNWQKAYNYGQRNYSELAVQRYQRTIGNSMHARELSRQKQEAMIGCGVINKMTSLGMPQSYRTA